MDSGNSSNDFTLRGIFFWPVFTVGIAVLSGSASAFFLWSLDEATRLRFSHPWLLWLLPLAALVTLLTYHRHGGEVGRGTDLILDRIHRPGAGVPFRLMPLVLAGSLLTHLCGGSAGREGTAVQMGGGFAGGLLGWFRITRERHPFALMAGVAAGFGSVFGTPLAGAVFAVEVLTVGRYRLRALPLCLAASFLADRVCHLCGAAHGSYAVAAVAPAPSLCARSVLIGLACGLAARAFVAGGHGLASLTGRLSPHWLRAFPGTLAVLLLALILGTDAYLGLGTLSSVPGGFTLSSCFVTEANVPVMAFFWKGLFTVLTLSAGCKGGEVTPLFMVGAALGNVMATSLGMPAGLGAALGFVAVFAGAAKTPLACVILGCEIFGWGFAPLLLLSSLSSLLAAGPGGLYRAQARPEVGWLGYFRK